MNEIDKNLSSLPSPDDIQNILGIIPPIKNYKDASHAIKELSNNIIFISNSFDNLQFWMRDHIRDIYARLRSVEEKLSVRNK